MLAVVFSASFRGKMCFAVSPLSPSGWFSAIFRGKVIRYTLKTAVLDIAFVAVNSPPVIAVLGRFSAGSSVKTRLVFGLVAELVNFSAKFRGKVTLLYVCVLLARPPFLG